MEISVPWRQPWPFYTHSDHSYNTVFQMPACLFLEHRQLLLRTLVFFFFNIQN